MAIRKPKKKTLFLLAAGIAGILATAGFAWIRPLLFADFVESVQAKVETADNQTSDQSKADNSTESPPSKRAAESETQHSGNGGHEEQLALNAEQLKNLGIEVGIAEQGTIPATLERLAEINFDENRVVHVVPRVPGVVSSVDVAEGQKVDKDALLAVLHSRELAELQANYLANSKKRELAGQTFDRERRLWEKGVSSEKGYLEQKTALAEADIAVMVSAQKLRALGLSRQYVDALSFGADVDLTTYEIRAPLAGIVTKRHISLGEAVETDNDVFVIADPSGVWVDITIYPSDMTLVRAGQKVRVDLGDGEPVQGTVSFVTPDVNEETRTAVARVVIDSVDGRLKPGMFVKAEIEVGEAQARVRLPKSAIQNFSNSLVVFVKEGESFEPRPVQVGRDSQRFVEVVSGLDPGEEYVTDGAFTIKSLIQKSQMGEGHGH